MMFYLRRKNLVFIKTPWRPVQWWEALCWTMLLILFVIWIFSDASFFRTNSLPGMMPFSCTELSFGTRGKTFSLRRLPPKAIIKRFPVVIINLRVHEIENSLSSNFKNDRKKTPFIKKNYVSKTYWILLVPIGTWAATYCFATTYVFCSFNFIQIA